MLITSAPQEFHNFLLENFCFLYNKPSKTDSENVIT